MVNVMKPQKLVPNMIIL